MLKPIIEHSFMRLMDFWCAHRPQPQPSPQAIRQCKLIAHRGAHDPPAIIENTLPAFERAAAAGVWGVEFDIRWTRDLVPVVIHDPDLLRLYGKPERIADLTREALYRHAPGIPSLADVVSRFGRRLHLMIEVKEPHWPEPVRQHHILRETLSALSAVEDFHLMTLDPQILQPLTDFTPQCRIAIAYQWPTRLSRWVMRNHWGGLCGHYALLGRKVVRDHHSKDKLWEQAMPPRAIACSGK